MASIYKSLGDYAKAEPLCKRSLAIRENAHGPDHPDVAVSLNNMALLYFEQGDFARAEPFCRKALEINEKSPGPDLLMVEVNLSLLASIYQRSGDPDKAEPLYKRALEIKKKALGPDHPGVATILNRLANFYYTLGDYSKAEPLYKKALRIREKSLEPDDPDLIRSLNNLTGLYRRLGHYAKSESLYKRALDIRGNVLGPDHPDVAIALKYLARLYDSIEKYKQSEALLKRALPIAAYTGKPELLGSVQYCYSQHLALQGYPGPAIFFGKQSVNTIQEQRGSLSGMNQARWKSFRDRKDYFYKDLADLLRDEGRHPEARQVLAMLEEEVPSDFVRIDSGAEDIRTTLTFYTQEENPWATRYQEIISQLACMGKEMGELGQKTKLGLTDTEKERREQLRNDLKEAKKVFEQYLLDMMNEFGRENKEGPEKGSWEKRYGFTGWHTVRQGDFNVYAAIIPSVFRSKTSSV